MNVETSAALRGIFKAYDIRGVVPGELHEDLAERIGRAYATYLDRHGDGPVVLGRDGRLSSESLARAFGNGVLAAGRNIIDIGLVTTPLLYFAVNRLHAAGGVMTTASHNPGKYNGFKLVRTSAIPMGRGMGLDEVLKLATEGHLSPVRTPGVRTEQSLQQAYTKFFVDRFRAPLRTPLVIDTGNGAVGPSLSPVLQALDLDCTPLYFEPNGAFPHHEANPLLRDNLEELMRVLASRPGAIGVAFDGDGDRVVFVDESGRIAGGDEMTALLASDILDRSGPSAILYDLRSSHSVPETIRKFGGTPVRMRVGHVFMKQAMREYEAAFGGELSCHYYYRDFFNCESGILTMLLVLQLLAETGQTLAHLLKPYQLYAQSGEISFHVKDALACMEGIQSEFSDGDIDKLDGLTVQYPKWWFNLRASNTEPLLRLNLEADSESLMTAKVAQVEGWLATHAAGGPRA